MKVLLSTNSLSIGYKDKPIMTELNFNLFENEVVSILGSNGIGKSTLIKTLIGELPKISGDIFIIGKSLATISKRELSQLVAIVTTERVQAGGLRVEELVSLGRHPHTGYFGKLSSADKHIVTDAINAVGIGHKATAFVSELSDGERQKAMIARAIAQQTPIIILDEPFSFLDTASRIEILSLLKKISNDNNVGILLSSHDVSQAMRMSDRIILIDKHREIHSGKPTEIVSSGVIQTMFDTNGVIYDPSQSDFISIH